VAYCCGEFVNSYILARLKVLTNGRHLWLRTIGSTVFGEAVDSSIFYPLAFWGAGIFPDERIPQIMLMQFLVKTGVEVLFTPVTYWVVGTLKRVEHEDWYDRDTDFNPFRFEARRIPSHHNGAVLHCTNAGADACLPACRRRSGNTHRIRPLASRHDAGIDLALAG
jgi:hypothetical protein